MDDARYARAVVAPGASDKGIVARPRLMAVMDGAFDFPVTLVCAPAGCGKSALVASWAARRRVRAVWVDCARLRDVRDEGSFWGAVSLALEGLCSVGEPGPSDGRILSYEDALDRACAVDFDAFLVFENCQAAARDASVHRSIARFLGMLPSTLHAIVISRSFPRIGLARLRMDGQLLELRYADLAFTALETRQLLMAAGLDVDERAAARAFERTHGWLASLKFAIAACDDSASLSSQDVWDRSDRMLYDYLAEEVIADLPADAAAFLTSTACLGSFDATLAAEALGMDVGEAARLTDELDEEGLFLREEAGAGMETAYSYHPRLAAALSKHARCSSGIVRVELLRRASACCEARGLSDDAVRYAEAACDWGLVASLVMGHWRELHAANDITTLHRWIEGVPERFIECHPGLCVLDSVALALLGRREQVFARLRVAKAHLKEGTGDFTEALYYAMRCLAVSVLGEMDDARESSLRALELLSADESHLRAMVQQVLGGSLLPDDPCGAIEAFLRAEEEQAKTGLIAPLCSIYANLASLCSITGRCVEAASWAQRAKALYPVDEHGRYPMLVMAYLAAGETLYIRDATEDAACELRFVHAHIDAQRMRDLEARMLLADALAARFAGSKEDEARLAKRAFEASPFGAMAAMPPLSCLKEWIAAGVVEHADVRAAFGHCADASPLRRMAELCFAFACGRIDRDLYDESIALARDCAGMPMAAVRAFEVAACTAEALGNGDDAERCLSSAFDIAESERMDRVFLDDADLIADCWKRVARLRRSSYAEILLKSVSSRAALTPVGCDDVLLTSRELDVIRLAADGLSTQQIAERLFVSRETVKKHLSNIYSKLGVHAKMQAVAVLRRLGAL